MRRAPLKDVRVTVPGIGKANRDMLVRQIQDAVINQLPEDEPDCTRVWVYDTAIRETLKWAEYNIWPRRNERQRKQAVASGRAPLRYRPKPKSEPAKQRRKKRRRIEKEKEYGD
jgi:hypothetical protein